jgi:glucuronoarabinoxylan endo-1,4-beta-xylanase
MKRFKHAFIVFFVVTALMVFTRNDILAATATVDTSEIHQTIEGFGASLAWWYWDLYSLTTREAVYNYLFKELGLDILRLRNIYRKGEDYGFSILGEIVDSFYSYSENDPKIMISSWSPPGDLKSNNSISNGGTLDTTETGEYVYGDFAQYWVDALNRFAEVDIKPEYISIQNEPDYTATWESCRFYFTENAAMAGYDRALDTVYLKLQELETPPKILGPECIGISYNTFQNYVAEFNHNEYIYGYAYHLYHGGSENNTDPDAFIPNLTTIATNYSDKPIFETEYDYGGWFNTAWLMHNCLVYGNVSGYFYWTIVSSSSGSNAFITVSGGSSYTISQVYWAFRQYSKAIHSGWKRVGANVDDDSLRISAYISPGNDELSIVVINISHSNDSMDLSVPGFDISGANMLRTSAGEKCDYIGDYNGSTLDLPARSITTISTLYIEDVSGIEEENYDSPNTFDFSLAQNYPNPFNARTIIEYSIREAGFVKLAIYDMLGREVKILVERIMPAGKHTVDVGLTGLSSGIYFYRLETGGKNIQKKMVLVR